MDEHTESLIQQLTDRIASTQLHMLATRNTVQLLAQEVLELKKRMTAYECFTEDEVLSADSDPDV